MRRLDELHLEHPFYGSRQMTRHLRREGVLAGRHRVRRLMRLMGMEAVYRKPRTSVANPEHRVYPYLLRDLGDRPPGPRVVRRHHLHPLLHDGFFYLVAVMDWASRHVLSWRLSNTMDSAFCIEALDAALRCRRPGDLQHGPGRAVHQYRVHRAGASRWRALLHGRSRPLPRQHLHRVDCGAR